MTAPQSNEGEGRVSQNNEASTPRKAKPPKRWHERTSVTLCVAAALAVVGLGFIHVITGVTNPYGLPFDIVFRESFGYRETVIDPRRIGSLPYSAARFKYPLSIAALQRAGYLPDSPWFEGQMMARQRESVERWQREFEAAPGQPTAGGLGELRGQEPPDGTDPEDPVACNQRGIAAARQGSYQAALAEFSRAIQRDPTCADAFYNRAIVSLEIGNLGQAASDLGTLLEIRPEFVAGHVRRGRLYVAMNEHDKAIAEFTKAIAMDPKCAEALFHRSLAHYTRGDFEQALEDVRAIQDLGLTVPAGFLQALHGPSESGRMRVSSRFHD